MRFRDMAAGIPDYLKLDPWLPNTNVILPLLKKLQG